MLIFWKLASPFVKCVLFQKTDRYVFLKRAAGQFKLRMRDISDPVEMSSLQVFCCFCRESGWYVAVISIVCVTWRMAVPFAYLMGYFQVLPTALLIATFIDLGYL